MPRPSSRREWCKASFAIPDFDYINNLAHFDYQRDRVFVRSSERLRQARSRARKDKGRKRHRVAERIEIRCQECPSCQSTSLTEWYDGRQSRVVMDLKITAGGIRRRFVRVTSPRYRCQECGETFAPPEYLRVDRHSHSLKSWAMYEHVAHRVSLENLSESFRECFGLRVKIRDPWVQAPHGAVLRDDPGTTPGEAHRRQRHPCRRDRGERQRGSARPTSGSSRTSRR